MARGRDVTRRRAAVLASGGGSNLQALLDHLAALGEARALDVVLVASDRASAGALDRAKGAGITTALIGGTGEDVATLLGGDAIDIVVLAGYLKLVPAALTRRFEGRMLNVHPGPLPDFGGPGMYGRRVHRAVLAAGVPYSGPTVHLVDEVYDHGRALAHWPVPVLPADDEHSLAARVLRAEHVLFPRVVQVLARDGVPGRGVVLPPFDASQDDRALAAVVESAVGTQ